MRKLKLKPKPMTNTLISTYLHPDHYSLIDAVDQAFRRLMRDPALHYSPIYGWDNYILGRTPAAPSPASPTSPPYELLRVEWCTENWDHMAELVSETSVGIFATVEDIMAEIEKETA